MSLARTKPWQRQRAGLLNSALIVADRKVREEKASIKSALAEAVRSIKGTLLCNGKFLRISDPTMRRAWDDWHAKGKTVDALMLEYKGGAVAISPDLVCEFQRRATNAGVLNISAAIQSLLRDWEHNRPIAGLGTRDDYCLQKGLPLDATPDFPVCTRTLYRWKPTAAERAGGVHGQARLRAVGPYVDMDYSTLRKCELYTLDDVRLDILCADEATARVVEVTMYVLMEVSSRYIVSWVIKPANAIKQEDVDELIAHGLQVNGFGIGVGYTTHIKFERGTIACSEGAQIVLEGGSGGRLKVMRTSMDGGIRWVGAPRDVASGHASGKAVIESFFRRLHVALMDLPGQRGNNYGNTPQNLGYNGPDSFSPGSLAAEVDKLLKIQHASRGRIKLRLPMLYLRQVRMAVSAAMKAHNHSSGHDYTGHGSFIQREVLPGVWHEDQA